MPESDRSNPQSTGMDRALAVPRYLANDRGCYPPVARPVIPLVPTQWQRSIRIGSRVDQASAGAGARRLRGADSGGMPSGQALRLPGWYDLECHAPRRRKIDKVPHAFIKDRHPWLRFQVGHCRIHVVHGDREVPAAQITVRRDGRVLIGRVPFREFDRGMAIAHEGEARLGARVDVVPAREPIVGKGDGIVQRDEVKAQHLRKEGDGLLQIRHDIAEVVEGHGSGNATRGEQCTVGHSVLLYIMNRSWAPVTACPYSWARGPAATATMEPAPVLPSTHQASLARLRFQFRKRPSSACFASGGMASSVSRDVMRMVWRICAR